MIKKECKTLECVINECNRYDTVARIYIFYIHCKKKTAGKIMGIVFFFFHHKIDKSSPV